MHLERVTFKDNPVHVVNAGGAGVLLRNSGNTDVYIFAYGGVRDDFYIDDPTAGLRIGVGETITLPVKQGNNRYPARTNVFAATDESGGPSAAPAADSPARTYSAVARGYYGEGMLARVLLGVALAAMSVLLPPRARADPDNDFLSQLSSYGIDLSDLMGRTITPQKAIEFGHLICDDLRHGTQPEAEMNVFYRAMPKITDKQADNLMAAAQLTICPDTL